MLPVQSKRANLMFHCNFECTFLAHRTGKSLKSGTNEKIKRVWVWVFDRIYCKMLSCYIIALEWCVSKWKTTSNGKTRMFMRLHIAMRRDEETDSEKSVFWNSFNFRCVCLYRNRIRSRLSKFSATIKIYEISICKMVEYFMRRFAQTM